MRPGATKVGQFFLNGLGFLKWTQLHPKDVAKLPNFEAKYHGRVFLCADVKSLQILWEEKSGDRFAFAHETVDYDQYNSAQKMLDEETFDDSGECFEEGTIWELMNDGMERDFSDESPPPVMTFKEIRDNSLAAKH